MVGAVLRSGVAIVCATAALMLCSGATRRVHAQAKPTTVVFFAPPELPSDLRSALEDALTAQLSLLPAALRYETATATPPALVDRLQVAKKTALEHDALAVFWLDVNPSGPWYLYAVDARAERMVMRPLAGRSSSREADIEAVALIVRATTDALLHGEPLAAATDTTSTPFPTRKPWPTEHAHGQSALRLSAAYMGTTFSKQLAWQHGFAVRGAWLWPAGPYVGIGYTFIPPLHFNIFPVRFRIDRYPFAVYAGLRFRQGDLTFSGELGGEIELRNRRTLAVAGDFDPDPDQRKIIFNICPKLEAEYAVTQWLVVFAGVGMDVVLSNFAYTTRNTETKEMTTILNPHWIRLTLHVGLGIIR
jgi:hypothetical protein